jgi:hypothetical protein
MDTSNFACASSACEVGPGNVGERFAAALNVTGDGVTQAVEAYYGDYFIMKIISGSLPPGLQLTLPSSEWTINGTPTKAGTYLFTVQVTPTQDVAPNGGPSGTQQLSVTIGAGTSDRVHMTRAVWSPNSVNKYLQLAGFDANAGVTYTAYVTSTGHELGTFTESTLWNDGSFLSNFRVAPNAGILSETNAGTVTITDSLGGSVTFPITVSLKYS